MRILPPIYDCTNAYDGVAVEIYVSGCTRGCTGCHNPELQNFDYGILLNEENLQKLKIELLTKSKWYDIISILGVDLLCQTREDAEGFSRFLKHYWSDKTLYLFTGADFDDLPKWVFDVYDIIKCGVYVQELHQYTFPASSNQRIFKKGVDY